MPTLATKWDGEYRGRQIQIVRSTFGFDVVLEGDKVTQINGTDGGVSDFRLRGKTVTIKIALEPGRIFNVWLDDERCVMKETA